MVGKEGILVARWLASIGFQAFVLVHRFPNSETGPQASLDDARRALVLMDDNGFGKDLGICGLSSGGHLAAALLAHYPTIWTPPSPTLPTVAFAIIGYGPISTNAVGRTIIPNKPALAPPEKQAFYDVVQPDVQLLQPAPPTFIVYSGNDDVVPVVNAYRLAEGIGKAGGAAELHVFADAPHGFALGYEDLPVSKWPVLCEAWMGQIGKLG
jgi:acetyl esterase/lipase